jgi:Na+/H+-dicarboxylate symporter
MSADTLWFTLRWIAIVALLIWAFRRRTLTPWIVAAIFVGAEIGHDWPSTGVKLAIFGQIFLKLIRTIVAPLLFATLVVGIAGHSNLRQVGRMGIKSLIYFEVVTTFALIIGWAAITLSKAGIGMTIPPASGQPPPLSPPQSATEIILHAFPENIARAVAEGQVLQIVVFAVIFAMALALVRPDRRRPMLEFCESLAETMFKFTGIVMYLAPIGVAGAIAYTVGQMGITVLGNLAKLLLTFYVALAVFIGAVLVPVALLFRIPIKRFASAVAEPFSIAFATTSSEAALPSAIEEMERLGVPRHIVAFVIPTGYSFNLDGSTLYLSLASVFVAQAAGIEMTFAQQMVMILTLMLTSKGVAGVPRASLVILMGTAASFGLPSEPIFVMFGIDALMDMARTSTNVLGNCLASVVVARWEGEFVERPLEPAKMA